MRKLILASAIALLSTSAFAGGERGLSMPQPTVPQPAVQQVSDQQRPMHRAEVTVLPGPAEQPAVTTPPSLEEKLKAAGELRPDGTPARQPQPQIQSLPQPQAQVQAPVPAPVPAPIPTRVTAKPQPELVVTPEPSRPVARAEKPARRVAQAHAEKPANKRVAHRGESTEHKARRIAARFGIYW